ncbi:Ferredoxin (Iron-sulfur cluster-binding protein) [Desulfamplus magnetovallimortis]|uniref:Ferredoxin (Iron-sulfur cluster-binding protein) n=1 Tax=Desulfamplus magnetovallimortis TaxID=1246637 RepID=A0A1W1H8X9_9BACT|nr:DUF362 domain-containing protein [Desulfamplus magnetovallimortis]SLM28855.1 Ferredoxin (Iron-sulfur cluster-binding protein) [Desulfamplus magnetovallimortis]
MTKNLSNESKVYFTDFKANSRENLPDKLQRMIETAGILDVLDKKDLTAIKLHFGEKGNVAFIRPPYIRRIIQTVRKAEALPFLTDANTLYAGTRSNTVSHIQTAVENGFSYSSMDGAPIIIADGLRGKSETDVEINQKHCRYVHIGSEIVSADALISVAHVKGHELSGFGGTLKNLGMGCASRKGKLEQHSNVSPTIKKKNCIGCGNCAEHCPGNAISLEDKKASINTEDCIGCGECILRCPTGSVNIRWNQTIPVFLEKMMEYSLGVLKNKEGKCFFINFVTDISPACDCMSYNDRPIVGDIGVLASNDPVAIDQAAVDLINAEAALPGTCLKKNIQPGEDKFKGLYPDVNWEIQLEYAEKIGLGNRQYTLEKVKTLTWK